MEFIDFETPIEIFHIFNIYNKHDENGNVVGYCARCDEPESPIYHDNKLSTLKSTLRSEIKYMKFQLAGTDVRKECGLQIIDFVTGDLV